MKTSLRFLVSILIITLANLTNISTSFGQTPNKMSYQAVIRDANGQLLASQSVSVQFSILQGSENGTAVYIETHSLTTNNNGLITLMIGDGSSVSGSFETIDWANGPYFIKTETDPTGGFDYSITATSQLLSVPFALHAKTAESVEETDPLFSASPLCTVTQIDIDSWSNKLADFNEVDPIFTASPFSNLSQTDIDNWNNKLDEFIESDPAFAASLASGIATTDTAYWNSKLDEFIETDPTFLAHPSAGITEQDLNKWNALWIWYTTNEKGYISTETDPVFVASIAKGITAADTTAWNTAVSSGASEIDDLIDGKTDASSIFIGTGSGANDDGTNQNTALGIMTLNANTSGYENTAVGEAALYSNTTGSSNTANGNRALYSNTTGTENTANGSYTLTSNTTGIQNTANGNRALYSNTTGFLNTANGNLALRSNTTGNLNTANGSIALYNNTTGDENTANGSYALYSNTTGKHNTINGSFALYSNTTGNYNTANGNYSLGSNTTGSQNTANGYMAGYSATGSGNIFLGYNAGYNETASNKLYIENSSSATPLIYGDFSKDSLRINGKLEVVSTLKIEGGTPGAGKILTSDANGLASWENASGASELDELTDGKTDEQNLFLGSSSGANHVTNNTSKYYRNTAIGINTLKQNVSGEGNLAIGYNSLSMITTGFNTAIGTSVMAASTTGVTNTAVGAFAMNGNTEGFTNTATGYSALGSNKTGDYNVAFGAQSLNYNLYGNNNTALGYQAGSGANGSSNVFLGNQAGSGAGDISNRLYIDNSSDSTPLIYGDFSKDSLRVNGKLEVASTLKIEGGNPALGKVLTSDANGVANWETTSIDTANLLQDADRDTKIQMEKTTDADKISFEVAGTERWVMDGTRLEPKNTGYSVFIGEGAGRNDDLSDNYNIFIGTNTGYTNTTGDMNTAIGSNAFYSNSSGSTNIAIGAFALTTNTTGSSNTAIGSSALNLNTTGTSNTAIGYSTLVKNTTGASNTANGSLALFNNLTGYRNTATGYQSLYSNTEGHDNSAYGYSALSSNTSGIYNTASGQRSLYLNTTGDKNSGFGYQSLEKNETGDENTASGYRALYNNSEGSGNVALGYSAGLNETGDDKLYIENSSSTTPLIYGDFANDSLRINGKLEVSSTLKIEGGTPGTGKVLTSDANGVASWENASDSIASLDQAYDKGGAGLGRTINADAGAFNVAGVDGVLFAGTYGSGTLPASSAGTRMMWYPKKAAFRAGQFETESSWKDASIGNYSIALGFSTVASGTQSTAFGCSSEASGIRSTAMGHSTTASGNYSTAMGLSTNAIGLQSTSMGDHTTAGSYASVALGRYNVGGGSYSSWLATDPIFEIGIGSGSSDKANAMTVLKNGKVGIGTHTPDTTLHIIGSLKMVDGNQGNGKVLTSDANGLASWETASSGASEIDGLSDAKTGGKSVFLGSGAGANDDETDNYNVAVGYNTLNTNTTGLYNSAVGSQALFSNLSGHSNVANGYKALYTNSTGNDNTAIGREALIVSTGAANTGIGSKTLHANTGGYYNTAIGGYALNSNTIGLRNTAIGLNSLKANTEGSDNAALGYEAGFSNIIGSGNLFLGYKAGYSETGSNKLYIENTVSATPLIKGDFDADSLRINGDLKVSGTLKIEGGTPGNGKVLTSDANGVASWEEPTYEFVNDGGNTLGIGSSTSYSFQAPSGKRFITNGVKMSPDYSTGLLIRIELTNVNGSFTAHVENTSGEELTITLQAIQTDL